VRCAAARGARHCCSLAALPPHREHHVAAAAPRQHQHLVHDGGQVVEIGGARALGGAPRRVRQRRRRHGHVA
jgi:hypothetical protein